MAAYGYYKGYSTYDAPSSDRRTGYGSPHPPTPTYVTETVVRQHVHSSPLASEYKHGNPLGHDSWQDYGGDHHAGRYGHHPRKEEEFFNKIQTEASQPKFGHSSYNGPDHRRHSPESAAYDRNYGNYNDYNESSNKQYSKPGGKMYQNESFDDDYYRKQGMMITNGGDPRHRAHATRSSPPYGSLTRPTSDIGEVVGLLKEVAAERMDVKEAAIRYGKYYFNSSSRPTIDSTEAARKYGGRTVL